MRQITKHIIHCSDSLTGDVVAIRQWHLARGWQDVGYHFIIRRDGEIELGRMLPTIGAHCQGHNQGSIGTCLIGKTDFAAEQIRALQRLHASLQMQFPRLHLFGHRDFTSSKTCPNFDVHTLNWEGI